MLSLAMRGMRVVRDDKTQCPRLQGLVALVGKHSDTVMRCKFLAWRHFISQEREQNEVDAREALRRQIKAGMIFVALRMGCARAAQQRFYADLLKMSRGRRLARVVLGTWQTGACMLALGRIMTVRAEARAEARARAIQSRLMAAWQKRCQDEHLQARQLRWWRVRAGFKVAGDIVERWRGCVRGRRAQRRQKEASDVRRWARKARRCFEAWGFAQAGQHHARTVVGRQRVKSQRRLLRSLLDIWVWKVRIALGTLALRTRGVLRVLQAVVQQWVSTLGTPSTQPTSMVRFIAGRRVPGARRWPA